MLRGVAVFCLKGWLMGSRFLELMDSRLFKLMGSRLLNDG